MHDISPPNRCISACIEGLSTAICQPERPDSAVPVCMCPNGDDTRWPPLADDRVAPDSAESIGWFRTATAAMAGSSAAMVATAVASFYSFRRSDSCRMAVRMACASPAIQYPLFCASHSAIQTVESSCFFFRLIIRREFKFFGTKNALFSSTQNYFCVVQICLCRTSATTT